jgi:hypothetical protein
MTCSAVYEVPLIYLEEEEEEDLEKTKWIEKQKNKTRDKIKETEQTAQHEDASSSPSQGRAQPIDRG